MKDIAYYNGAIGRIDEIRAPITDRGLYFGDGVYDAAMVRNKKYSRSRTILTAFITAWRCSVSIRQWSGTHSPPC